jgi:DNA polymerase IV (DinB-like DNA polymerase)
VYSVIIILKLTRLKNPMDKARVVLHLDLDYFYAQAEETRDASLKGRPVVVCMYTDRERGKGAVATSNYVARKFGVKSGIPVYHAKKLLEGTGAAFLPADFTLYEKLSIGVAEIVASHGSAFEPASIDEFFIDITEASGGDFSKARETAKEIKREIQRKCGLTGSVGIGPNKLVAKIASDFKKPDGLTVVPPEAVREFLDPLDADAIPGIGRKSREFLASRDIHTIRELREKDSAVLVEWFGKAIGAWLVNASRGIDESPVAPVTEQKQFSRIMTLKEASSSITVIAAAISRLVPELVEELKTDGVACKTIGVNAVDANMHPLARSRTLQFPTQDGEMIRKTAAELYGELLGGMDVPLRRVGVRVEHLVSVKGQKRLGEF